MLKLLKVQDYSITNKEGNRNKEERVLHITKGNWTAQIKGNNNYTDSNHKIIANSELRPHQKAS